MKSHQFNIVLSTRYISAKTPSICNANLCAASSTLPQSFIVLIRSFVRVGFKRAPPFN